MKKLIYITLFATQAVFCQIHLNGGITDISNRLDGDTMTFSTGYSHFFESIGTKANYRRTSVRGLNFDSVDVVAVYRYEERGLRIEPSVGVSYNDVDWQIDPLVGIRASVRLDDGVWAIMDFDNIAAEKNITHWLIGVAVDLKWYGGKIRFF
ncbi:hypothetical protein FGF1_03950 [Flavobacteriaceae bacterium GF1]